MNKNLIQISGDVNIPARWLKEEHKHLTDHKRGSKIAAITYEKTDLWDREKKAYRLRSCGETIVYAENPGGGDPISISAMRCGIRLCPSCSWIRARKIFQNVYYVITDKAFSGKQFIFITLTVKNVPGDKLSSAIKHINDGIRKLTSNRHMPFRKSFLGTFRAVEITYNRFRNDYHHHIHIMAAVEPGYFRKSNPDYISHERLLKLWKEVCNLNYRPRVHIKKVRNSTRKQVAEVAKYTVKTADYLNRPNVIQVLDPALRGKRLIAYGGLFKTVKAKLNLPDEYQLEEFPKLTVEELLHNPYIRKIIFEWKMGAYHVSLMEPSTDPDEWLEPGRVLAELIKWQTSPRGQGV